MAVNDTAVQGYRMKIVFAGKDVSGQSNKVSLEVKKQIDDVTPFRQTWRLGGSGLREWSGSLDIFYNEAANEAAEEFWAAFVGAGAVEIELSPGGSSGDWVWNGSVHVESFSVEASPSGGYSMVGVRIAGCGELDDGRGATGDVVVLVANQANDSNRGHVFRTLDFRGASPTWEDVTPVNWAFVSSLLTEPVRCVAVKINQLTGSVWVTLRGNNNRFCVMRSLNALSAVAGAVAWDMVPFQTATSPPVAPSSHPWRHPRVLFDDTLVLGPYVAIRYVEGDAGGGVQNENRQYMIVYADDFNVISLTSIGDSAGWSDSSMVEFNDDVTGYLSYHTYSGQVRRLTVPFGTAFGDLLSYVGANNRPAWLRSDPIISVGTAGERMTGGDANDMYVLSEASLETGVDDRVLVLDFDNDEINPAVTASEQPVARSLGLRPGWRWLISARPGYYGLWGDTGSGFSVMEGTTALSRLNVRPELYPGDDPFVVFFERDYYDGAHTEGRVYAWMVDSGTLVEKTGNLHSLVAGAWWGDGPIIRKPLDVLWGS